MPQMESNTQRLPAQPVLPANDYYTFLIHSLSHSMFEKLSETSAKISQFGRSPQTQ
jgi:hypothetical protein